MTPPEQHRKVVTVCEPVLIMTDQDNRTSGAGMSTQTSTPHAPPRSTVRGGVLLSAISAVSWGFLAMAGVAALGLHLLGADTAGSLGPMTAAVMVMAVGGHVSPSGDVAVFGLSGAGAQGAIEIMPLGVGLVGALLVGGVFLRSLRSAGLEIGAGELAARAGAVAVLFVALLGGLAWAGQDTIAVDGSSLTGGDQGGGDDGGLFGQLPGVGDLIDPKTSVSFHVDTVSSLLAGLAWVLGVLVIALLVSRRTPLPRGLAAVHRGVRPHGLGALRGAAARRGGRLGRGGLRGHRRRPPRPDHGGRPAGRAERGVAGGAAGAVRTLAGHRDR